MLLVDQFRSKILLIVTSRIDFACLFNCRTPSVELIRNRYLFIYASCQVLLPSSSFMSPADAKTGASLNRVRIFGNKELTPTVSSQKWDIVKVICTQPFNKTINYGLSFIRFYVPAEQIEETETGTAPKVNLLSACRFILKVASSSSVAVEPDDEKMLKPGGLFKISRENSREEDNKPEKTRNFVFIFYSLSSM